MSYVEQHMVEALANHTLAEITPKGSPVRAFSLCSERGRMMSVLLLFTPEGIVLMGDLRLTTRGVVAAYHYDLPWFCGARSEDYLCSKFLRKEWQPEVAGKDLQRLLSDHNDISPESGGALRKVLDDIENMTQHEFLGATEGLLDTEVAAGLGLDYNLADAGWLVTIQKRFSMLYPTCG